MSPLSFSKVATLKFPIVFFFSSTYELFPSPTALSSIPGNVDLPLFGFDLKLQLQLLSFSKGIMKMIRSDQVNGL